MWGRKKSFDLSPTVAEARFLEKKGCRGLDKETAATWRGPRWSHSKQRLDWTNEKDAGAPLIDSQGVLRKKKTNERGEQDGVQEASTTKNGEQAGTYQNSPF